MLQLSSAPAKHNILTLYQVTLEWFGNYTDRKNYGFSNLDGNLEPIIYAWITSPTNNNQYDTM